MPRLVVRSRYKTVEYHNRLLGYKPVFNCIATLVIVGLAAVAAFAEESGLKRDFLAKYEPAAKRLESFYRNVRIVATEVKQPPPESVKPATTKRLDFRENGDLIRLDSILGSGEKGNISVVVANPARSFVATRPDDASPFRLDSLDNRYLDRAAGIISRARFSIAPFGWTYCSLLEIIRKPSLEITRIQEVKQGEEALVKVFFLNHEEVVKGFKGTGWFNFSPKLCWAIRSASTWADPIRAQDESHHIVVEYDGERDGIPLLSRARYWAEVGPEHKMGYRRTYTVNELTVGPIPESEFVPAAIGITVPDVGAKPGFNRYLLLGLISLILVLACILVARHRSEVFGRRSS
jgi:hypothetical protein